ncbi:MAG: hypothetical protein ACI31C_02875 [Muribaculaceae bacterium]
MNDNKNILEGANHDDGMTVPPCYFADFKQKMAQSLPARPELQAPVVAPRSRWQRLRPYVYLAAMFGGIWCMLKLFTMLTTTSATPLESNPVIAEALSNEQFVNEYVISDLSQWDLYDEFIDSGIYPDSLCCCDLSNL